MTEVVNVTITAPDAEWLRKTTHALIDAKIAASGNLISSATSVYRWQGAIQEAEEAIVTLRTQRRHVAAIVDLVKDSHPYEVPHVVAVPIVEANPDYRKWIIETTGGVEE